MPALSPQDSVNSPEHLPELVHNLRHNSSVLALAVSPKHGCIFAGTQDGEIVTWSLATFHQVRRIQAHKGSVLSLSLSPDESLLFSSAGDPLINVWCPKSLRRTCEIYSTYDVGDVFCTAYSQQHNILYIGAQNASIQWLSLKEYSDPSMPDPKKHPDKRNHRFFDSKPIGGSSTPRRSEDRWNSIPQAQKLCEIPSAAVRNFSHYGYVYCMLMAKGPTVEVGSEDDVLISGSGDGTIKLWRLNTNTQTDEVISTRGAITEIMTLGTDDADSVLSLAIDGSFLYSGKLDGMVELWDLDTAQKLRVIKAHEHDIWALQMSAGHLWVASSNGSVAKFSTAHYCSHRHRTSNKIAIKYQCLARWRAHEGKILASGITTDQDNNFYITGANDDTISVWAYNDDSASDTDTSGEVDDVLLSTLRDFVSYKTISSKPEYAEDCRKGATFLGSLFKRLGGQVEMLRTENHHNPVVYAKFSGKLASSRPRKRILFYGHYDVVSADNEQGAWNSDPFTIKGADGYLYGRGVSDNKGPTLAALYAVTDLMQAQKLDNDVIFLIEGEEEFGSRGFEEAVKRNKILIGKVDYILLANSYWLDDDVPCLTYGLRGVLHATVCVDSPRPDAHSGVDGSSMINEPLSDLTQVLSTLKGPRNRVELPGFYDGIATVTPGEDQLYDEIVSILMRRNKQAQPEQQLKQTLMARWRVPNLTIHRYKVSGPEGSLISSHASAHISFRLVPGQEVDDIATTLTNFIRNKFAKLESQNNLKVTINNKAESWLGDPTNAIFRTLERAILEAWPDCFDESSRSNQLQRVQSANASSSTRDRSASPGGPLSKPKKPLYIREGGSIPAIRFLEKEFDAPAAHLPCGRASDAAHLDNERMSVLNLIKAREIFSKVFGGL